MEGGNQYKKGLWTEEEDKILIDYVKMHGKGQWNRVAKKTGLKRCGKSCRLRWMNYLSPSVKQGSFTEEEEDLIIRLHNLLGNRWSLIAGRVPGRTDNQVKNYWNTHLCKKLGIKKQSRRVGVSAPTKSRAVKVSEPIIDSSSSPSSGATNIINEVNEGTQKAVEASDTQEVVIDEDYVNSFWASDREFLELSSPSLLESLDGYSLDLVWNGL
ncbi:hypothetical protein L1049_002840 [Liquidambar formosana]|uniref:Uncharacterized protein n=1 Tax=Liquidambar formosana TaxID=63359 RepID=A0AAP0NI94_LIQFO